MPVLFRLLAGAPLALLAAILLFLAMRGLIAVAVAPLADKQEPAVIDINPQVREEELPERTAEPEPAVLAPPPVEPLPTPRAAAQTEGAITLTWELPQLQRPDLARAVNFTVSDRDAQPSIRFPGAYPPRAQEAGLEGECRMRFDVGPDGLPFNIHAVACTNSIFAPPSIRAVETWRYSPKIVNGAPVARIGVESRLEYQLAD